MSLEFTVREITVAVTNLDEAGRRLAGAFDSKIDGVVDFPQSGLQLQMGGIWLGDFHVALVTAPLGEGPVGRFLERRGEGVYEVNVRTNDLTAAIEHMKRQGLRFVSEEPHILKDYDWDGEIFSELRIVFVDPATSHGVLIELAEWVK